MSLEIIAELSRFYGADERFVLAGGGNTSFKDEKFLYVKPSGVALADIEPAQFVKLDRALVKQCYAFTAIGDVDERERRIGALLTYAALSPPGPAPRWSPRSTTCCLTSSWSTPIRCWSTP